MTWKKRESGDDDVVDTPVPIPNTEVKHHSGYGIVRESGKLPGSFFLLFYSIKKVINDFDKFITFIILENLYFYNYF